MIPKNVRIVKTQVEKLLLPNVRRPGRYIGGEVNQIRKNLSDCDIRVALCFPDVCEIGSSHTGLAILYELLNRTEGVAAERVFSPWIDAEQIMRTEKIPLFTLESKAAAGDFDIIAISVTNEIACSNVLNLLDLAGLPVRSENRGDDDPLVLVGGQASNCAEPLADFVDMFFLGQAEDALPELVKFYRRCKGAGLSKKGFLSAAAENFDFLYVPSLYKVEYRDGEFAGVLPISGSAGPKLQNAVVDDFENSVVPERPVIPFVAAVHDRITVEVMRGCPGRCRFCQASFCRRPIRYRSAERVADIAQKQYAATGYDTVSLLSLSTGEYPHLAEVVKKLNEAFAGKHVGISVPSLRVDQELALLPEMVSTVRKSGLTIAVEAASEKLRQVINKPISNENLFAAVLNAYRAGFKTLKLYFMVGFPGETDADIEAIADLSIHLSRMKKEIDGRVAVINAAVSWLVPKPHTPFGWLGQKPSQYFEKARKIILDRKRTFGAKAVAFKFHDISTSVLESAIARGDRRLCAVIETAWKNGAKFDLWTECFKPDVWRQAFASNGLDMDACAQKEFFPGRPLPWSHLGGPEEKHLLEHYRQAMEQADSLQ